MRKWKYSLTVMTPSPINLLWRQTWRFPVSLECFDNAVVDVIGDK